MRLNVDLIVTRGTVAALAAKKATSTIPVASGEPLGLGLIASLARPGGNVTGQSSQATDTYGKRVELLKEVVPGVTRVSALMNPSSQNCCPGIV